MGAAAFLAQGAASLGLDQALQKESDAGTFADQMHAVDQAKQSNAFSNTMNMLKVANAMQNLIATIVTKSISQLQQLWNG